MRSMSTPNYVCAVVLAMAGLTCLSSPGNAQPTMTRVSVSSAGEQGNGNSFRAALSADGRYVAFMSLATNLVAGDTNGVLDVFVHDRQTGATTRVSVSSAGGQGNLPSSNAVLSADGRYVAFESDAVNLVAGDTNGTRDIFVHDRQTGATTRVSVSSAGEQGNGRSFRAALSADGRYVAFDSDASNLVAGDTNGSSDIFVHDRQTGATTRVSVSTAGEQANGDSGRAALSADGRYVAFESNASNLVAGDTNGTGDIFVHDRQTGATTRVNVSSAGGQGNLSSRSPVLSADGRYVAFQSFASNLVAGDTNGRPDVFVHDRQTGATTRVSVSSAGEQGNERSAIQLTTSVSVSVLSADGRYVVFESLASNLVAGDTNGTSDVFVHDRETGATTRVSMSSAGEQGDNHSHYPAISADGRHVAFQSEASNLVAGDTNGTLDVFVRDTSDTTPPVVNELFDDDGKADLAVWRPATGTWYVIRSSDGTVRSREWGLGTAPYDDVPVPGDYDGDGAPDLAVWRPSTGVWYVLRSSDGAMLSQAWGAGFAPYHDIPVPADYDGDGKTDLAVWRASSGFWYILRSSDGTMMSQPWGAGVAPYHDIPVPADYDGDGKADIAVWRPSSGVWYILRSSDGTIVSQAWGAGFAPYHDVPVPGDYDGDGRTDIAVWRASTGVWYILRSSDGHMVTQPWGAGFAPYHDIPVPADYDGDGKTDIAVWRPSMGTWYILRSSDGGFEAVQWGAGFEPFNDVPVPR